MSINAPSKYFKTSSFAMGNLVLIKSLEKAGENASQGEITMHCFRTHISVILLRATHSIKKSAHVVALKYFRFCVDTDLQFFNSSMVE